MRTRLLLLPTLAAAALGAALTPASVSAESVSLDANGNIALQILAINDFHANLEPPSGSSGRVGSVDAGGAEYLSTHLQKLRAGKPYTVSVTAGDVIGASPLLSGLFHDEPTIEALSDMGFEISAVGNHEFDEGAKELLRISEGGCGPDNSCKLRPYAGSTMLFTSASPVDKSGNTLLPSSVVRSFGGVKVAFIGAPTITTPTIVTPGGVAGLEFIAVTKAVNAEVERLKAKWSDLHAFVVLLHEGDMTTGGINECKGMSGPVEPIVKALDKDVDIVLTGHSHRGYVCKYDGRMVAQGLSYGRVITDVAGALSPASKDFTSVNITNRIVTRDVEKDPIQTSIISRWKAISAPIANRVIGSIQADITRTANAAGESALGDLIADSQLYATQDGANGGAQIALMNPGGIRTDMLFKQSSGGEKEGDVTYGEAFSVQPFGNNVMVLTLTGAVLKEALEQQFDNPAAGQNRILQVSKGFTYSYDVKKAAGARVSNMKLNGTAIDPAATYNVTVNNFLADGGDNFKAFTKNTKSIGGVVDLDALEMYLRSSVSPKTTDGKIQSRISLG